MSTAELVKSLEAELTPVKLNVLTDVKEPQKFPWERDGEVIPSDSVDDLVCGDVFEFVPGKLRGVFMDEVYRVMKVGAKGLFVVRYWSTSGAIQDYMYEAPTISEQSFLYFNKGWRDANKLVRPIVCDFDFTYGYTIEPDTTMKHDDVKTYNIKYYNNVVTALQIMLTKRAPRGE